MATLDASRIKKGNPVEFNRVCKAVHTMGDGEIGIAIEDERKNGSVRVELADESTYLAKYVVAFAWSGWLPEELERAYATHNPTLDDMCDI